MFALRIRFLAGRYHATPWGRNVNEADIALAAGTVAGASGAHRRVLAQGRS